MIGGGEVLFGGNRLVSGIGRYFLRGLLVVLRLPEVRLDMKIEGDVRCHGVLCVVFAFPLF